MTWDDDPTSRMVATQSTNQYPVHHYHERRETVAVAAIVVLTFIIGVSAVLAAMLTLSNTIDRLLAVPICQETK